MSVVTLRDVGIEFPVYGVSAQSLKRQLLRVSTGGVLGKTQHNDMVTIKALNSINLELHHGDKLGLLGHNGAGKSTLLRVLTEIYEPTTGHIEINGKVSALLDVMMGMDVELTGHENITARGMFHGLTRKEINRKRDEIVDFSELGDYLSMPVRTYSSGMTLRLAFSIATAIVPEILVLDEVIGAGDASFMKKSQARIQSMIETSKVVVLASHSAEVIANNCNKALLLNAGQVQYFGSVDEGLRIYEESIKG